MTNARVHSMTEGYASTKNISRTEGLKISRGVLFDAINEGTVLYGILREINNIPDTPCRFIMSLE